MITALEIKTLHIELFATMSKFGAVHDEHFDCQPGDYLIMYRLRDLSYGVFAKHDTLERLLLHICDIDGMCNVDGTPIEFSYWHLVV